MYTNLYNRRLKHRDSGYGCRYIFDLESYCKHKNQAAQLVVGLRNARYVQQSYMDSQHSMIEMIEHTIKTC